MEKDYSLLRPFNLEAAKAGEGICWFNSPVRWVSTTDHSSVYTNIVEHSDGLSYVRSEELKMVPLVWVEGKPVYAGDCLYRGICGEFVEASYITTSTYTGFEYLYYKNTSHGNSEILQGVVEDLTWKKPKQKREGWINIYENSTPSKIYETQLIALKNSMPDVVDTVKVEWEE